MWVVWVVLVVCSWHDLQNTYGTKNRFKLRSGSLPHVHGLIRGLLDTHRQPLFYLANDLLRLFARVSRIANRPADHNVVRAGGDSLHRRYRAFLVAERVAGRTDAGADQRELAAATRAQH